MVLFIVFIILPKMLIKTILLETNLLKIKPGKDLDFSCHAKGRRASVGQIKQIINSAEIVVTINLANLLLGISRTLEILDLLIKHEATLDTISLDRNSIDLASAERADLFAQSIARFKNLRSIDLSENLLTGRSAVKIVRYLTHHCPKLHTVDLRNITIDDKTVKALSRFSICINLQGSRNISPETKCMLATELTIGVTVEKNNKNVFEINKITGPIDIHNYFFTKDHVECLPPTLKALSLFKIKSKPRLQAKVGNLPVELQDELKREMRF